MTLLGNRQQCIVIKSTSTRDCLMLLSSETAIGWNFHFLPFPKFNLQKAIQVKENQTNCNCCRCRRWTTFVDEDIPPLEPLPEWYWRGYTSTGTSSGMILARIYLHWNLFRNDTGEDIPPLEPLPEWYWRGYTSTGTSSGMIHCLYHCTVWSGGLHKPFL